MELTAQQRSKLVRLAGRMTLYEVTATKPGHRTHLACYCANTKAAAFRALSKRADRIAAFCGTSEISETWPLRCGGWVFSFSGRTEREAITQGEHPYMPEPERPDSRPQEPAR